jgi:hypothetical protein
MTNLQPGPEMDKAVCEIVGISERDVLYQMETTGSVAIPYKRCRREYPKVSTSFAECELVLKWLRDIDEMISIQSDRGMWTLSYSELPDPGRYNTIPEALCRAVLLTRKSLHV